MHLDGSVAYQSKKSGSLLFRLGLLACTPHLLSQIHKSLQVGKYIVHFLVDGTFYLLFWKGKPIICKKPTDE